MKTRQDETLVIALCVLLLLLSELIGKLPI